MAFAEMWRRWYGNPEQKRNSGNPWGFSIAWFYFSKWRIYSDGDETSGFSLIALGLIGVVSQGALYPIAHSDGTRFRGPNGTGIAEGKTPTPTQWSEKENLKWKILLPGAGVSCPILVDNKTIYAVEGRGGGSVAEVKNDK